jgi:hypothetical protein
VVPAVEVAPNATASPPVTFYAALANMTDAERACFSLAWSASTSTTPNATARGSNATFAFAGVTRRAWYATVAVESAATGAVVLRANISASTFALKPNASYVTVAALAQNWTVAACPTPTFLVLRWVGPGPFLLHAVAALEGLRIVGRLPASMLGNRTMNCTAILGRVAAVVATGLGAEVTLGALNYTDVFAELDIDVADLHAAAAGAGVPMALVARSDAEAAGPIRQPVAGIDNLASPLRGTSRTLDCTFSGSAQDGLEGGVHCDFSIVDGALTISVGAGLTLAARLPFVYRISGGELQEAKAGIDGTILGSVSVAAQLAGDVVVDLAKVRLFNHRFYCTHFGFHVPCFVMVGDIPVVYLPYVKGSLSTTFSFVDKASISYSRSVTMSGAIAAVYERGHGGSFEHATSCVPSKGALDVSASCSMALTDGAELEAGVEVMFAIEAAATLGLSDTMSFTQPSPQCVGATEGSLADTVELDVKGHREGLRVGCDGAAVEKGVARGTNVHVGAAQRGLRAGGLLLPHARVPVLHGVRRRIEQPDRVRRFLQGAADAVHRVRPAGRRFVLQLPGLRGTVLQRLRHLLPVPQQRVAGVLHALFDLIGELPEHKRNVMTRRHDPCGHHGLLPNGLTRDALA